MKKSSADVLGSTFYLARIRSLEIRSYSIQIAVMAGLAFFLSLIQGATFKPFYFPLEYFMYVVYIMLSAIFFESFFFTVLEMRNQGTDAARYYTAKRASRNAVKIMVFAIVFLVLLANPVSERTLEDMASDEMTYSLDPNGNISFEMTSVDRFGLIDNSISIEGLSFSGHYDCYLFYKSYYYPGIKDPASSSRLRFLNQNASSALTISAPDGGFEEYVVLIVAGQNSTGTFHVTFHKDVKDSFVIYTGVFMISTAIIHAWWFVYLQNYIRKYGTELVNV